MQNPCYILESHFRGVPEDANDDRCHFRRYILDIYLENAEKTMNQQIEKVREQLQEIDVEQIGELMIQED